MAVFDWIYTDDLTGIWNPMDVVNPTKNFYIRGQETVGGELKVVIKEVVVCTDSFTPEIALSSVVAGEDITYTLTVNGIPAGEIDGITWTVVETVDGVDTPVAYTTPRTVTGLQKVCASAIVDIKCGCPDIEIGETCFTFDGNDVCEGNSIGLNIVIENGTYKPVRSGTINCCVALDYIMWKINVNDPWEIIRLNETIFANEIWFKRVVVFTGGICQTMTYEVKAK